MPFGLLDGRKPERPLNFAHRGARLQAPENTLPAFRLALDLGADGIEMDVHLSRDGCPVVIHDAKISRTTDGVGWVRQFKVTELQGFDAGSYFSDEYQGVRVPLLNDVLEALSGLCLFNIEIKSLNGAILLARSVVERLQAYRVAEDTIISSFNPLVLTYLHRVFPGVALGILHGPQPRPFGTWVARLLSPICVAVHPHHTAVDAGYLSWARPRFKMVNVWTVNEAHDIKQMIASKVDLIISDQPDVVASCLARAA